MFNAVMEIAIGRSKVKIRGTNVVKIMACSDDVAIIGIRVKDVREVFT
jgi:hypothetical protein